MSGTNLTCPAPVQAAARMLASSEIILQRTWIDDAASLRRRTVKGLTELALLRDSDIDAVLAEVASKGTDPLRAAAATLVAAHEGAYAIESSQISDARRIVYGALPHEVVELATGISRRLSVQMRWANLPLDCQQVEIGDAHVHSGGASPPVIVLRGLLDHLYEVTSVGLPLELEDVLGHRFDGEPLLFALGISALALQVPRLANDLSGLLPVLGSDARELWERAFELARTKDELQLDLLRAAYAHATELVGATPDLTAANQGAARWLRNELAGPAAELARGSLGALALLHGSLVSPTSGSLDIFVERFNLLRRLRRLSMQSETRRIEDSLRFLLSAGRLCRLELRKTAGASIAQDGGQSRLDAYSTVLEDARCHLTAVKKVREDHGSLVVQMPISFFRHRLEPREPLMGYLPLRHPIHDALALSAGVARACRDTPGLGRFIGGFDVVGRESDTPNWVFSLAFSFADRLFRAAEMQPLGYSVHAGEQFAFALDGLRRIGELDLFEVPVSRVGHALALSPQAAENIAPFTSAAAASVLEALVWSAVVVPELEGEVADLCEDLASVVFAPSQPTFADLKQWLTGRFSYDRMQALGIVPPIAQDAMFPTDESVLLGGLECQSLVDKLLAATAVEASVGGVYFNEVVPVPNALESAVGAKLARCYEACGAVVAEPFRSRRLIESCPSSNVAVGGIRGFAEHPIGEFRDAGLCVTVSSDDPGLFGGLVEEELASLYETGALNGSSGDGQALMQVIKTSARSTASGLSSVEADEVIQQVGASLGVL
ncbi:hypothetical protein [Baekduia sp. Peel2402]|uniref:hypothetical protein n=1 Tax=Baekduia sp. Peel2402 TaxID=3458296 RepID=UPI00403E8613